MAKRASLQRLRQEATASPVHVSDETQPLARLEDISTLSNDELADQARNAHQAVCSHLADALQAGIVAGRILLTARERMPGRTFRPWLQSIGIPKTSAYRYIEIAEHAALVSQAGTLAEAMKLIAASKGSRTEASECTKPRRLTLRLSESLDARLARIADARNIKVSDLVAQVMENWLKRQQLPTISSDDA